MSKPSLKSSLIRIWSKESSDSSPIIVGAGFVVTPEYAVTCAHVINSALDRDEDDQRSPGPDERISLDFLGSDVPRAEAEVLHWFPVHDNPESNELEDIAVLKLIDPLPAGVYPVSFAKAGEQVNRVRMCGFPGDARHGTYLTGMVQGAIKNGWIELHPEDNRSADPGFSGTAAWDMEQHTVCGMIVSRQIRAGSIHNVYMIPAGRLIKAFPEVENMIRYGAQKEVAGDKDFCIILRLNDIVTDEYESTLLKMIYKVIFNFISNDSDKVDSITSIFSSSLEEFRNKDCDNRSMKKYLNNLFEKNKRISKWITDGTFRRVVICVNDFNLIAQKNDWNKRIREDFVSFLQERYNFLFYIDYFYLIHYGGSHSSNKEEKSTDDPDETAKGENDLSIQRLEEYSIKILDVLRRYLNNLNTSHPGSEASKEKITVYYRCLTNERDGYLAAKKAYDKDKDDVLIYQEFQDARCSLADLIRYIEGEIFQSESLGVTEEDGEDIMPISIEKRSADAEKFLKELQEIILLGDFERIYIDNYSSLEREVDSCLVNLRKWRDFFYERRVKAEGNQGNVKIQSDYEDARHNLEYSLLATEKLWNKNYRSKFADTFDSLKEQVVNNTIQIQDSEQQTTFLEKLEITRQQLEMPLKVGEMATKFCKYIGPGITFIFSKLI